MYVHKKQFNYTELEVCKNLARAKLLSGGGIETMQLSERIEPWFCLFRPFSHNTATRVHYWPECEI